MVWARLAVTAHHSMGYERLPAAPTQLRDEAVADISLVKRGLHLGRSFWNHLFQSRPKLVTVGHTPSASENGEVFMVDALPDGCNYDVYSFSTTHATLSHTGRFQAPFFECPKRTGAIVANEGLIVWDARSLHYFDFGIQQWSTSQPALPQPAPRLFPSVLTLASKIFLFGGVDAKGQCLNDLWALDVDSLKTSAVWQRYEPSTSKVPCGRIGHVCVAIGDVLYLFGGANKRSYLNDTWLFHIPTRTWKELRTPGFIPKPRAFHGASVCNGMVYVYGGETSFRRTLSDLVVFNYIEQRWSNPQHHFPSLQGRSGPAVVSFEGKLFIFGGVMTSANGAGCEIVDVVNRGSPTYNPILQSTTAGPESVDPRLMLRSATNNDTTFKYFLPCDMDKIRLSPADSHMVEMVSLKPVGLGGYCDVFVGRHRVNNIMLAMKRPRICDAAPDRNDILRRFRREAEHWSGFDHPNILPYFGDMEIENDLYLVSPWMELGDLQTILLHRARNSASSSRSLSNNCARRKLYSSFNEKITINQIASGIAYLHSLNFVHGDIRSKNVLIGPDGRALICDFGLTKALDASGITSDAMKGAGTTRWKSPELFRNESKTAKSDVFAFSMTIVEVLTGTYPLPGLHDEAFLHQVTLGPHRPPAEPRSRSGVDFQPMWKVASLCWNADANRRPSMDEVLEKLE